MIAAKTDALTRRANKLIEWLKRDQYAVYRDRNTSRQLVWLIDLIIYALELSIPKNEWLPFLKRFKVARELARYVPERENETKEFYENTVLMLIRILGKYADYISLQKEIEN